MIEFFNVFLLNLILKFFCKYVENNIFGFFINSNFNEKENLKELFPYSYKNVIFNFFLLMIIQLLFSAKSIILWLPDEEETCIN